MNYFTRHIFAIFYSLSPIVSFSQTNLVPNSSFEIYSSCPYDLGEINKAIPWFQPCTQFSSTDFFHICSTFTASVPSNFLGYQMPKSGLGYAGLAMYSRPHNLNYREYLEIKLLDSLLSGKEYCVEFYVSLADKYNIITDALEVYFSRDSVISNNFKNLPYTPQIQNPMGNLLHDTSKWVKITGSFVATGGEKFMTIGNFKNDVNTYVDTLSTNSWGAYMYIDDVSVKEMVTVTADAGTNQNICITDSTLLGNSQINARFQYTWNPTIGLSNVNIAQPSAKPTTTTKYYLTVIDTSMGCSFPIIDSVIVTVLPYQTPTTNIITAPTICIGDTISIGTTAIVGYKYLWSPINNLSDATSAMPFAFPKQTTQYHLIVMDTASTYLCKTNGTDSVLITVDECPPIIPNIFTPNGDWINDEFVINNLPEGSSLTIYNRWGVEVISYISSGSHATHNQQLSTIQWDGRTTSGVACVNGVYYYVLTLKAGKVYNGFVELVR